MRIIKKVTDEDIKYILDHADMTNKELSQILGYNWSTIRGVKRRFGIIKKYEYDDDEIIRMYSECHNANAVAKEMNMCKKTVLEILRGHGIDTSHTPILSSDEENFVVEHYNDMSSNELAGMFGCSESKISQVWSNHGLRGKQNRTYSIDESCFDDIDSGEKAYLLGFICADGCIYHSPNQQKQDILRISLKSDDEEILHLFKRSFKCDKPISYYTRNGNMYAAIEIVSQRTVDNIRKLGIDYKKTYGNTIPNIDDKFMFDFIRGYFDGDGSISKDRGGCISIAGYKSNIMKMVEFCERYNILLSFIQDKRKYNGDDQFGSLITTNMTNKYCLIKKMYENCGEYRMTRKYEIAMDFVREIEDSDDIRYKQIVLYNRYAVQDAS